jgi:hypothetical protein
VGAECLAPIVPAKVNHQHLLRQLAGEIVIPQAVLTEIEGRPAQDVVFSGTSTSSVVGELLSGGIVRPPAGSGRIGQGRDVVEGIRPTVVLPVGES